MKKIVLVLSLLFSFTTIFSQAPGSDCEFAITVLSDGCSAAGQFDNSAITGTLAPPTCFGTGNNNGMWFQFQASGPVVNVTVNGGTLAQPMVTLLSSTTPCANPFTELVCNSTTTNTVNLTYSALTVGTIYYLYVDGANNNVGTFQLCLTSPAQPSNDNPCNATVLPNVQNFCSGPNSFTNVGASSEPLMSTFLPNCFDNPGTMNSVYFTFTAVGTTAEITIDGNLVRPQIALISPTAGCSGTAYNVNGCFQAASGNSATLTVTSTVIGQTYYILVDGFSTNTGTFQLCINNYNPSGTVQNDNCTNAILLCPNNQYFATTVGATPVGDPLIAQWNCNGVVNNSVWFRFTTTNPVQPINFSINGICTGGALQFEVFRKTSGGDPCATDNQWTSVGCSDAINPSGSSSIAIPAASLLPSTNYYVVVDNFPDEACDFDFTITGNQGAAAGLDQSVCLSAPAFNLNGFTPSTGGVWSGPGVSAAGNFNPATAGIGTHSLFYSFAGCTDVKKVTITAPSVSVSPDVNLCIGQCTTLLANATQTQTNVTNPSFSNNTSASIPDNNTTGVTSNITTTGLSNSSFPSSVCLNITHGWLSDIDIYLRCPNGTIIELSTDNGGSGDNYTNTCFNLTSAVSITSGSAPFSAASGYLPENSLSQLNGCNMNGTWSLIVKDDASIFSGTLNNWTITFTNSVTSNIAAPFSWSPTTDMTNSTTLTPQVCPTTTTTSSQTYTLTATDANGCIATDQVTVSTAPLSITASNDQTICPNGSATLVANGANSYVWASPNAGDLSSANGSSVTASPSVTTTYTVTGTSGTCTDTEEITVTVGANLTPTLTADTVCANQTLNLTSDVLNATSYTWTGPNGFTSSIQNPTINNAATAYSGTYSCTIVLNGCSGTATIDALVNQVPTLSAITSQTLCPFTNTNAVNFSGTTGATFNWTNTNINTGLTTATGAGNIPSFVATNTTTATISSQVVVTPTLNGCDGTAQTFTITVSPPGTLSFTMDSLDLTCASANSGAITITPGGANYTYDWISGPTNYTLPTTSQSNLVNLPEGEYCVEINSPSQSAGNVTIFTETFENGITNWTLNNANGTNIWVNNNSYIGGTCASVGFTSSPTPNQPAAITNSPQSYYLHIVATNSLPVTCGAGSVNFPPLNANFNGSQASTQYATLNTPINTVGLSNVTVSFYWLGDGDANDYAILESSIDGGTTWVQAGAILNNQTTWIQTTRTSATWANIANLRFRFKWINNSSSSQDPPIAIDQIVVTADAPASCPSQATQCATLIAPPVNYPTFAQVDSICQGEAINLPTSSNNTTPILGTWSPSVNNQATTTYTFTPNVGQCAEDTIMEVAVKPIPDLTAVTSQTVCAGQDVSAISYSSTVIGAIINWNNTTSSIGLATTGTGNINSFTGSNSGNIPITATITATPSANGCTGIAETFSLTVNPIPQLTAINSQTVCAGETVNGISFITSVTGTTVNWTNTDPTIGLAASGNTDIASFTGINNGNTSLQVSITGTPTVNGCDGLAQTFSITVNPIPVLTSVASQTVCAGQTVNGVTFSSSVSGSTIDWTNTEAGIGLPANGTGNISSFTGINNGTTPTTATLSAIPTVNGCDGLAQTFSVTVNPNPTDINELPLNENCGLSDGSINITSTTGGTAPFQYSFNGGPFLSSPLTFNNLSAGNYTINVLDTNGCSYSEIVTLSNNPGPVADFTASQLSGFDSINVVFTNQSQSSAGANVNYYWNFGNGKDTTTTNLSYSPSQPYFGVNSYTVTLLVSNGNPLCNDTTSLFIYVDITPFIEIPNVFSPNGDGLNEFFSIKYKGYKNLNMIIFNRWGNKLFETSNPGAGWDGTGASEGTYYYIVTGTGSDNKNFEAKGYLTLVR